ERAHTFTSRFIEHRAMQFADEALNNLKTTTISEYTEHLFIAVGGFLVVVFITLGLWFLPKLLIRDNSRQPQKAENEKQPLKQDKEVAHHIQPAFMKVTKEDEQIHALQLVGTFVRKSGGYFLHVCIIHHDQH
ncbi:hypothetical protein PENTCL1PPCAC_7937, partial [Pristionchus entomophagus]